VKAIGGAPARPDALRRLAIYALLPRHFGFLIAALIIAG
jgi:hypothetical protein